MKESKTISPLKGSSWYTTTETRYFNTVIVGQEVNHKYFKLDIDGWLTIYPGYSYDGPTSVPYIKIFGRLLFRWIFRAALPHDVLYQAIRLSLIPKECRKQADILLKRLCIEDGAWKWQASIAYFILRKGAKSAADKKNARKKVTFP